MASLNQVTLIGNVGQDPEFRVTASGECVLRLSLATTETWIDKSNQEQERTEWHSVVIWGKRGEALSKIIRKGFRLAIVGRIQYRAYEKNGVKAKSTSVRADNVLLLERKPNGDRPTPPARPQPDEREGSLPIAGDGYDDPHDEIPF